MADVLAKGNLIPPELVSEMFNLVKGKSSLAKLSAQDPIPFTGQTEFTFTLDKEADIVAENGAKTVGGATIEPRTIVPYKFEYSMRTSDEFLYAAEDYRLNITQQFLDGCSRKFSRGLDIAAFHGVNPRTAAASTVVGTNNFDSAVTQTVTYAAATADDKLQAAVAMVYGAEKDITGIAMAPAVASDLANIKVNGVRQYPQFFLGQAPDTFGGLPLDINSTVASAATGASSNDMAIIGDFASSFRWGYAKQIPLEVIEYGNPDNDAVLGDLKGHNQVLLRCEAYIGWAILDGAAFARVIT